MGGSAFGRNRGQKAGSYCMSLGIRVLIPAVHRTVAGTSQILRLQAGVTGIRAFALAAILNLTAIWKAMGYFSAIDQVLHANLSLAGTWTEESSSAIRAA